MTNPSSRRAAHWRTCGALSGRARKSASSLYTSGLCFGRIAPPWVELDDAVNVSQGAVEVSFAKPGSDTRATDQSLRDHVVYRPTHAGFAVCARP